MKVAEARIELRERSFFDVVDLAVRVLGENAQLLFWWEVAFLLPVGVLALGIVRGVPSLWVAGGLVLLLADLSELPFLVMISRWVFGVPLSPRPVWGEVWRGLPRFLGARLLHGALVVVGSSLVVPGLWVGLLGVFVKEVVYLEGASVTGALERSFRMTVRRWKLALLCVVGGSLVHGAVAVVVARCLRVLVEDWLQYPGMLPPEGLPGRFLVELVGFWAFLPVSATIRLFAYLDARTRREGWDVQMKFMAMARDAARQEVPVP